TVKIIQYLLTHSFYAKSLSVSRVSNNKVKKTAGIDGELWTTPAQKMEALLYLTHKGYKASRLRRVYIDKKGKKRNV
ncbi:reverse transcriptase N-terminal domain-containing protein, partial [Streptococcus suis]